MKIIKNIEYLEDLYGINKAELLKKFGFEEFFGCKNISKLFKIFSQGRNWSIQIADHPKEIFGYIAVNTYIEIGEKPNEEISESDVIYNIEIDENIILTENEALRDWYDFLDDDAKSNYNYETDIRELIPFEEFSKIYTVYNSIGKSQTETLIDFDDFLYWIDEDDNAVIIKKNKK